MLSTKIGYKYFMSEYYSIHSQLNSLVGFEYIDDLSYNFYIIDFITGQKYPKEKDDIDFFKDVKKSYDWYIINFASEGDPRIPGYGFYPAFSQIHKYSKLHNVPIDKIILFSSNLKETDSYNQYCKENNIKNKFKIFIWAPLIYKITQFDHTLPSIKKRSFKKTFLCLNNGFRKIHRSWLTALIYNYNLDQESFLSCYPLEEKEINLFNRKDFPNKKLLTLENVFFHSNGNTAFSCPKQQVSQSAISIVNETHSSTFDDNMIDITEKVFKPILWMHPVIILGPKNINQDIEKLGFKTYEDFFDLSFDKENSHVHRYEHAVAHLVDLNKRIKNKKKWLKNRIDILEYNQKLIIDNTYNKNVLKNFLNYISDPN